MYRPWQRLNKIICRFNTHKWSFFPAGAKKFINALFMSLQCPDSRKDSSTLLKLWVQLANMEYFSRSLHRVNVIDLAMMDGWCRCEGKQEDAVEKKKFSFVHMQTSDCRTSSCTRDEMKDEEEDGFSVLCVHLLRIACFQSRILLFLFFIKVKGEDIDRHNPTSI